MSRVPTERRRSAAVPAENPRTIFRIHKTKRDPWVQVDKRIFENVELSWAARGLLGYLLSRPDNWQVRMGDLISRGPTGRDAMRRMVKELETAGYVRRGRERGGGGRLPGGGDRHEEQAAAAA